MYIDCDGIPLFSSVFVQVPLWMPHSLPSLLIVWKANLVRCIVVLKLHKSV